MIHIGHSPERQQNASAAVSVFLRVCGCLRRIY